MPSELKLAYRQCQQIARQHYENFPVASFILPAKIRAAVAVVYVFARRADDLADEGDAGNEQRLAQLTQMENELQQTIAGNLPDDFLYLALADVIKRFQIPTELFFDLTSAFKQDVVKKRYQNFGELMNYCRRSANPVGRLMLHLFAQADEKNLALSDGICSSLQLINFYQDLSQDYHEMQRIYIPLDDMEKFAVTEQHFAEGKNDSNMQKLMQYEYKRAEQLMRAGGWLGKRLSGRAGFEIRLIIAAGSRVLSKLKQLDDVFSRPRLGITDYVWIIWKAVRKK
ncbi:MAG: squalene synthase HpnC [Gammaproteobacteria bacterium]|nr:squalene synthase HpnC [Gammaproteobacteria bacterium]